MQYLRNEMYLDYLNCFAVMGERWQSNTSRRNISPSLKPSERKWKKSGEKTVVEWEDKRNEQMSKGNIFYLYTGTITDLVLQFLYKLICNFSSGVGNWTTPIYASSLAVPLRCHMWPSSQSTALKEACLMSCWTVTSRSTGALGE